MVRRCLLLDRKTFLACSLGSTRLNLIKFFSKTIQTISNDYTGEHIYQIFHKHHLFHILIDLFHHHIYNNFLHTQVYLIIRLVLHINATAVKQPNDIWTRTPLSHHVQSSQSGMHIQLKGRSDFRTSDQ